MRCGFCQTSAVRLRRKRPICTFSSPPDGEPAGATFVNRPPRAIPSREPSVRTLLEAPRPTQTAHGPLRRYAPRARTFGSRMVGSGPRRGGLKSRKLDRCMTEVVSGCAGVRGRARAGRSCTEARPSLGAARGVKAKFLSLEFLLSSKTGPEGRRRHRRRRAVLGRPKGGSVPHAVPGCHHGHPRHLSRLGSRC